MVSITRPVLDLTGSGLAIRTPPGGVPGPAWPPHQRPGWQPAHEVARFAVDGGAALLITDAGANLLHFGLGTGPVTVEVIATAAALAVT